MLIDAPTVEMTAKWPAPVGLFASNGWVAWNRTTVPIVLTSKWSLNSDAGCDTRGPKCLAIPCVRREVSNERSPERSRRTAFAMTVSSRPASVWMAATAALLFSASPETSLRTFKFSCEAASALSASALLGSRAPAKTRLEGEWASALTRPKPMPRLAPETGGTR